MPIFAWRKLAEERISRAVKNGELDNLAGKGKPLDLQDDSRVPEELRLAYKVLHNAGFTPPELQVRQEIMQVEELLATAPDEKARYKALKRLNFLTMKLGELRPRSTALEESRYAAKVAERLASKKDG